jgi:hypothetical protein
MSVDKTLTGRVPREAVRRMSLARLPASWLSEFSALGDLTGTVSDSLDNLGLAGAVPASLLAPTLPGKRIVGQAVTVRNVERAESPTRAAASRTGKMGEHEAYNPHVNLSGPMPDDADLVDLILEVVAEERLRQQLLVDNPAAFFGFDA